MNGSHFHIFVDGGCMHIQCSTEYIGETYNIVYLVGIVGTTCRHKNIGTGLHGFLVRNLWDRICQSKDDGVFSHATYHFLCKYVTFGKSHKHISTVNSLFQGVDITAVGGKETFLVVKIITIAGNNALRVKHEDVLFLCSQSHIQFGARDGCSTGTIDNDTHLFNILACYFKSILQTCS